jgi:hypothetical protein
MFAAIDIYNIAFYSLCDAYHYVGLPNLHSLWPSCALSLKQYDFTQRNNDAQATILTPLRGSLLGPDQFEDDPAQFG